MKTVGQIEEVLPEFPRSLVVPASVIKQPQPGGKS